MTRPESPKGADALALPQADRATHEQSPQAVSAAPVGIPSASEFVRVALTDRIAAMLDELGNPPLVGRIYPKGWQRADEAGLVNLYELCRRTFIQREKGNG